MKNKFIFENTFKTVKYSYNILIFCLYENNLITDI